MQALRQVSSQLILEGAYGRRYESKKEAMRDWYDGKDFKIVNGPYCSIRDLDAMLDICDGIRIHTKQGFISL